MAHEIRAAVRLKKNLPVLDLAEMAQAGASVVVPSHGDQWWFPLTEREMGKKDDCCLGISSEISEESLRRQFGTENFDRAAHHLFLLMKGESRMADLGQRQELVDLLRTLAGSARWPP